MKQIIIPTYNERDNIAKIVPQIFSYVPDASILVVDDNSPDGTKDIVFDMQNNFPRLFLLSRERKEGLGKAYIHAFEETIKNPSIKKIVTMDADFSHNPSYLPKMFEEAERHHVVIGSRYVPSGGVEGWELWRKALSKGGNFYCKTIMRLPLFDYTAGFHIIDVDILKKIKLSKINMSGYAFLIELKYLLWKAGASFKEVPIIFKNRVGGESKMSGHIIREGILAPWRIVFKK